MLVCIFSVTLVKIKSLSGNIPVKNENTAVFPLLLSLVESNDFLLIYPRDMNHVELLYLFL